LAFLENTDLHAEISLSILSLTCQWSDLPDLFFSLFPQYYYCRKWSGCQCLQTLSHCSISD